MAGAWNKTICFVIPAVILLVPSVTGAEDGWKREISLGYNRSSGNTDKSELSFSGKAKKALDESEFVAAADVYYSSANKKMDAQKWSALTRYFYNFGEEKKWFNSYQLTVDHDRFANIDYRLLPSAGLGYWFMNEDFFKAMAEGSLGYEITEYRSGGADDKEAVFIGRGYAERKVFRDSRVSEDLSVIPSLEGNGVRIKSETAFINPIAENLDFSIKFMVDHDSEPPAGIKKTDTRLVTALRYSF